MKVVSMTLVRTSRFQLPDRKLLFARARLYEDRLELSGFGLRGRYRRTLRLDEVCSVEWWSGAGKEPNLALQLHDGRSLAVWVPGPGLWKFAVEEHMPRLESKRTLEREERVSAA